MAKQSNTNQARTIKSLEVSRGALETVEDLGFRDPMMPLTLEDAVKELAVLRAKAAEADRLRNEIVVLQNSRKLGLHWEKSRIEAERARDPKPILPRLILEENGREVSRLTNDRGNLIIEGDNIDALRLLEKTHAGQVDCIYIDPPYNTGSTTFVYNDKIVDTEDKYRKSKWLSFLESRLLIARKLLSSRGCILVSINDEHRAVLELLLDEVFEGMKLGSIVWRTRQGTNLGNNGNISINHEHVLVYANTKFRFGGTKKSFSAYKNDDRDGRGPYETGDMSLGFSLQERRNLYFPIFNPITKLWYPANPDAVWRYASKYKMKPGQKIRTKTMEDFIADNKVRFPSGERTQIWETMDDLLAAIDAGDVPLNGKGVPLLRRGLPGLEFFVGKSVGWGTPRFKRHLSDIKSDNQPLSSWIYSSVDKEAEKVSDDLEMSVSLTSYLGTEAEGHLKAIFGEKVFNYAKPPSLMKGLIRQATSQDSLVLDFFAGSGTTGEAVLRLNEEDGGSRRFILVSSTEATENDASKNLCRDVTARRMAAVVDGYGVGKKHVEGTGDGFAYLRLERCEIRNLEDVLDEATIWTVIQMSQRRKVLTYELDQFYQMSKGEDIDLIYCPYLTDELLASFFSKISKPTLLYTGHDVSARQALEGRPVEVRQDYAVAEGIVKP